MTLISKTILVGVLGLAIGGCTAQASIGGTGEANSPPPATPPPPPPATAQPAPEPKPAPKPEAKPKPAAEEEDDDAVVEDDEIKIKKKIRFAVNSAEILPESSEILDKIAKVMKKNPQIKRVKVIGHTDLNGDAVANLTLSEARAASVVKALQDRNVKTDLKPIGKGETQPLCEEDTEDCHQRNRRVQFKIVD